MSLSINKISNISSFVANVEYSNMGHARLRHVNLNSIKRIMSLNLIPKSLIDLKQKCETCIEREINLLELVHCDVCDSNDLLTLGGKRYFITFIDDFSKYCYVYSVNHKNELFDKFKVYKTKVENQLERKIKILQSNRGKEYTSLDMSSFCEMYGIIHEVTPPYTPRSNGNAERKNHTLLDMVNAMLVSFGLSKNMWGKTLYSACHILNREGSL